MRRGSALKEALRNAKLKDSYKSVIEEDTAKQLDAAGIAYDYEKLIVPYEVPARTAKYKPDFPIRGTNILIECKGHFGANTNPRNRYANMKEHSAKERHKFVLLKQQHPELDIRFVFSRAKAPIYKGSPTSHKKWAEDHGFLWSEKTIPYEWLQEIAKQQKGC